MKLWCFICFKLKPMERKYQLFGTSVRLSYMAGILVSEELLNSRPLWQLALYRTYQALTSLIMLTIAVSQFAAISRYWGDVVILLETIANIAVTVLAIWVNVYMIVEERRLHQSINHKESNSVLLAPVIQTHPLLKQVFDNARRKLKLVLLGVQISIVCCVLFWIVSPFLIRFLQGEPSCEIPTNTTLTAAQLLRSDGYDQFCFIMWSPIDARKWYMFLLGYQVFCYIVGSKALFTFSTLLVHFYMITAAEFEMIGALVKLSDEDQPDSSSGHTLELVKQSKSTLPTATSTLYLKEVIKIHQATLEAADELNTIQGRCISGGVGSLMTIMICCLFEMTMVPSLTPKFLCIMLAASLQILVYSYFGEEIYNESEKVGELAYGTKWYDRSTEFKKLVLMLMVRTTEPTAWKLLGIVSMRVVVFSDISTVCYRVFMLLLQMEMEVTEVC